jgi:hypothetical protein
MRKYQFVKKEVNFSAAGYILVALSVYPEGEINTINISKESGLPTSFKFYIFSSFLPFSSLTEGALNAGSFNLDHTSHPYLVFDDSITTFPYTRRGAVPLHYKEIVSLKNPDLSLNYKIPLIVESNASVKVHVGLLLSFFTK